MAKSWVKFSPEKYNIKRTGVNILEKKEKEGLIFVIITIFIAGALPIIIKYGTGLINPLFFA
ncbi:unnamed protein product, partial [marine sediment metagenome]